MVDQPGAIPMWVPNNITFNYTDATWLVIHKTAGFQTAQDCAAYFQSGSGGNNVSAHYVVGLDGTIVQCVPESRGAGANCCPMEGHAPYLPTNINLNVKTISIEHIDPTSDNSTPVSDGQKAASFRLIHDICQRHNIPMRSGDASGGIIGHCDIDPVNRARCPGNYPWQELWSYLAGNGGSSVQNFSKDSSDFKNFGFSEDANGNWHQGGFVILGAIKNLYASLSPDGQTLPVLGLPKSNEKYITFTAANGKTGVVSLQYFERGCTAYNVSGEAFDSQPGFGRAYVAHQDHPVVIQNAPWYVPATPGPVVEKIPDAVLVDLKAVDAAYAKLKQDAKF